MAQSVPRSALECPRRELVRLHPGIAPAGPTASSVVSERATNPSMTFTFRGSWVDRFLGDAQFAVGQPTGSDGAAKSSRHWRVNVEAGYAEN